MSRLKLSLLGPPRVERDGAPIQVDTRKAIALLAYLAVTGASHSRDALAAFFWPDYDQAHARAALRRTLSALNKALGGEWLDTDREHIGLQRDAGLWVDVDEFHARLTECRSHGHRTTEECAGCVRPLTEATSLYRDDFLAGFTLRDSPDFDGWQFFQSESLRNELAGVLEKLVRCHTAQGEFQPAIEYARRWLSLDPLHESAHRQLMQLYAWTGQRAAALRQYRECVRLLEQELGVPPLDETTQLSQALEENRLPPPVQTEVRGQKSEAGGQDLQTATSPPSIFHYPLVGRSAEWATLLKTYDGIRADGRWVILEGEVGIGKTRLAEEFLAHVQARGAVIIKARCYEGETNLAYGPFVEGLRAEVARVDCARLENLPGHWLSEAARLLPELVDSLPAGTIPPAPPLDSPGAQSRFFEGISQVLLALCAGPSPCVLFFDDLQWIDEASLDLLTYLVRRLRGRPLLILVTWRGEQLPSGHRLHSLLTEAERSDTVTVLKLSRLSLAAVKELVQATASAPQEVGERLYRETEGVPFFLVEYLTMLTHAEGTLNGDWSLPVSARDLLHSRLAAASETGEQLLSTAAVIGRSFDFDTLRETSGRGDEEIVSALESLIAQGLVKEVRGAEGVGTLIYDFSHEKLRALVYEETSLARRRLLHRRVAEALVAHGRATRNSLRLASQIAQHFQLAGHDTEAAEYYRLAGEHARTLYANAEALAHLRLALALGHPQTATLHEAIGDLLTLSGDYRAALTEYETAAALCEPNVLGHLEHKLGNVHHRRGEWDHAESHFRAALAAWGETDFVGERARLYTDWSLTAHRRGQADQALELAFQAMKLAEGVGDAHALAQAHNILGILASSQGDLSQARHYLERSLTLAEALNDPGARAAALNNLALACGSNGDVERAIQLAETALAVCASQGDRHRAAALHNNLADLLHAAGKSEAALSHLKQAVTILSEIGVESGDIQPEVWKLVEW